MTKEQEVLFEQFYRSYFHEVVVYAYRFLGNWEEAEVVAQESFYVAICKIEEFTGKSNKVGWIKTVAKNKCLNMHRMRKRQYDLIVSLDALTIEPTAPTPNDTYFSVLDACSKALSKEELEIFKLVVLDGLPHIEIAKKFDISLWAAQKRIQRIEKKLKEYFSKHNY